MKFWTQSAGYRWLKAHPVCSLLLAALALCVGAALSPEATAGVVLAVIPGIGIDIGSVPVTGGLTTLLKDYYLPGVANATVTKNYMWNRLIGRGVKLIEGKQAIGKMRVANAMSLGYISNDGVMPKPTDGSYIEIKGMPSNFVGILGFTPDDENLSRTNLGSFKPILQEKMESLEAGAKDFLGATIWAGKTGYLARVAGSPAAGVITIDNDGLPHSTAKTRTRWLRVGMPIAAIASGAIVQNGMLITAIDPANDTITVSINGTTGAGATADNNYLVPGHLLGGQTGYNLNPTGITDWLGSASNTVWNVDRSLAANERYRPQRISPSQGESVEAFLGRAADIAWLNGADDNGMIDVTNGENFVWVTSAEGYRLYGASLVSTKRYVVPVTDGGGMGVSRELMLKGGFTALDADGRPMVRDRNCPVGHYYGMFWPDWQFHSVTGNLELQPTVVNGSPLQKVPFHRLFIMELEASHELNCVQPNRQIDAYGVTMTALNA